MKTKRGQSGFSLVELLVAVTIMLVLAGTVAVNLMKEPGKARVARAKSDIATLKTAIRLYESDNFAIPTQRQGLESLVARPTSEPIFSIFLMSSPAAPASTAPIIIEDSIMAAVLFS